jgi:AcrR family transcriptional regulator
MTTPDTPTLLLTTARRLFAQHGYAGTSIRQITSHARTNLGAVTYHFGSKERLYEAVLTGVVAPLAERILAAASSRGDPLDRLGAVIRAYFAHFAEYPDMPLFMVQQLVPSGPLPPPLLRAQQLIRDAIVSLIQAGQEAGVIRAGNPMLFAISIVSQPAFIFLARRPVAQVTGLDPDRPEVRGLLAEHAVTFVRQALVTNPEAIPK